jgi:small subunit ribosomal protein S9
MAEEPAVEATPDAPEEPTVEAPEQPAAEATPETPEEPTAEAEGDQLAVPSEEAAEIAGAVEDAPLEAFEEAAAAESAPEPAPLAEEVGGPAVPTEDAAEIAGVAEDAPLEAFEEAQAAAEPVAAVAEESVAEGSVAEDEAAEDEEDEAEEEPAPRVKPAVPGAHLEVDIVPEGADPLGRSEEPADPYAIEEEPQTEEQEGEEEPLAEPISTAAIDLAAGARYRATGKRKTAIARVTLRPGTGTYTVNGRTLEQHFPRSTLQRNIRQPLETVGYQDRMDVVARLHGGGISAQAGALRHGVSRALLEADPNLRGELKRRGFLTRDSRAKERKKAGLKKARKRPQFSKR